MSTEISIVEGTRPLFHPLIQHVMMKYLYSEPEKFARLFNLVQKLIQSDIDLVGVVWPPCIKQSISKAESILYKNKIQIET